MSATIHDFPSRPAAEQLADQQLENHLEKLERATLSIVSALHTIGELTQERDALRAELDQLKTAIAQLLLGKHF
jgi:chromosome segregation ATPase